MNFNSFELSSSSFQICGLLPEKVPLVILSSIFGAADNDDLTKKHFTFDRDSELSNRAWLEIVQNKRILWGGEIRTRATKPVTGWINSFSPLARTHSICSSLILKTHCHVCHLFFLLSLLSSPCCFSSHHFPQSLSLSFCDVIHIRLVTQQNQSIKDPEGGPLRGRKRTTSVISPLYDRKKKKKHFTQHFPQACSKMKSKHHKLFLDHKTSFAVQDTAFQVAAIYICML